MTLRQRAERTVAFLSERGLLGVSILTLAVLVGFVIVATGPQTEPQVMKEKAWPVSYVVADPDARRPALVAFGKVESRQQARLTTSVSVPVAEVLAPEGSWVEAGDLLVRLDGEELALALAVANAELKRREAALATARSDYEYAQNITEHHRSLKEIADNKLARHKDLAAQSMISESILDEARRESSERAITLERHLSDLRTFPNVIEQHEASVAEGQALVNRAALDARQARLTAPFAGRVIATHVSPGDRVRPGEVLVEVADYGEIEIRASVPASVGVTLRERMTAGYEISAVAEVDGRRVGLAMVRLAGDVKRGQTGVDAFFKPAGSDAPQIDIGRVVNLHIVLPAEQNVVALPVQSIYENDRVYRIVDSRLEALQVEPNKCKKFLKRV